MKPIKSVLSYCSNIILMLQPAFAIPLIFNVLNGAPGFWLSLAIGLLPVALRAWQEKKIFRRTAFDLPILIFVTGAVVGYFVAPNKDTAAGALVSLLASVLVYYGITANGHRGKGYWMGFGSFIILVSLLFSAWFFSQGNAKYFFFNQWAFDLFQPLPDTPKVSLGIHGIGALLSAVIPVTAGIFLYTRNRLSRVPVGLIILLLLFILFLSASGGGWIGAGIGVLAALICFRKRLLYLLLPVAAATFGMTMYFYTQGGWLYKALSIETLMGRINLWIKTLPLLGGAAAFWGNGLGNWAEVYFTRFQVMEIHTHNNYLQVYSDMGIFGVLAMLTALVIFIFTAARIIRTPQNALLKGIGVGLVGSFLGGTVFNALDVTLTGTLISDGIYTYLFIPFLWVWAGFYAVVLQRLPESTRPPEILYYE